MDRPLRGPLFFREALGWLLALCLLFAMTRPPHLMETLSAGAHRARVWWKVADTVRRHAAPLMRAELESWWSETLAARSAPRTPRA
ncbi:hypothetical protein HMI49_23350 [Corallococcus exercitus]|uniref:Uncharacterized protein n=1 Tax=Corallococcus exercitus TaxID=2316736 RepID=A0A7Y4NT15_9BACT|nr:hypothetical protein [Corallococcus exercitus]NOK36144.1 hypothetical protein [Corallococcus exercitus]